METTVRWLTPIELCLSRSRTSRTSEYCFEDPSEIPTTSGIYIFARSFRGSIEPLYVGQAKNLRSRLQTQLNNHRLMMGIKSARIGPRIVLLGEVPKRSGQNIANVLNVVERAIIDHLTEADWDLLNQQGTRRRVDKVRFEGNRQARSLLPIRPIKVPHR